MRMEIGPVVPRSHLDETKVGVCIAQSVDDRCPTIPVLLVSKQD